MRINSKAPKTALALVLGTMLGGTNALAGTVLKMTESDPETKESGTVTLQISDEAVRINQKRNGTEHTMIYRSDQDVMWIMDQKKNTYTEITREDLKNLGTTMADAQKRIQEQLKDMPPQQRAQMEKMLKGKMGTEEKQAQAVKFAKKDTGKVGSWSAQHWIGTRGDKKVVEVWTVESDRLGLSSKQRGTLQAMGSFFNEFGEQLRKMVPADTAVASGWEEKAFGEGVPVKTIHFRDGEKRSAFTLESVQSEKLASSLFDEPKQLQKKDLKIPS